MSRSAHDSTGLATRDLRVQPDPENDKNNVITGVKDASEPSSPPTKELNQPVQPKSGKRERLPRRSHRPTVPVARTGFWGGLWRHAFAYLYGWLGWEWLIIHPSMKEWMEGIRRDTDLKYLKAMTSNKKGGSGKTPVANAVAAIIAWVTQKSVLQIDANQTEGNTRSRLGITVTLSIRQTYEFLKAGGKFTHKWANAKLGHHPDPGYGSLRVIDSEDETKFNDDEALSEEAVMTVFTASDPEMANHVIDGANVLNGITRAAMNFIDVPMFVFREKHENSLDDCRKTYNYYERTMPEKAAKAVIVAVAHERDDSSAKDYAEFFGVRTSRIVIIPKDPFYVAPKVKNAKPSDKMIKVFRAQELRRDTLKAYFQLIRLLYKLQPPVSPDAFDPPQAEVPEKQDKTPVQSELTQGNVAESMSAAASHDSIATPVS